ncbi:MULTISPECIES: potassium-transporting ATPase subunit KdpC [Providencia]|uniref:Potassium-transporting ATPase KdpC subunit n=1 Tax=Providencia manganoxydans TaxID=2923283 RepID=A0ABX7ADK1_9GAMM|nr:potassium-transporting ATPase subunit KdpC [Providencia manganoxydans]MDX4947698.1 potassium-transporting ATPase subunit KdpC [Providencia manganoxydans]QQO61603.1 potassium-transporting ATPase subunit KdpC [Providencia manganoxydans]HEF8771434.1 potassium-transporting ATPase subunit KdpC [Providencia stuartii]
MNMLRSSIVVLALLAIITGVAYPLFVTGIANVLFPWQAKGSLIEQDNRVVGSVLIGQNYQSENYFLGRPSATADHPYNALASGASNLAVSNPELNEAFSQRSQQLRAQNPDATSILPVDLLTSSASGLDPDISVSAALYQAPRIAKNRQLSLKDVESLIAIQTQKPLFGFIGEPVVNVLQLNMALDELKQQLNLPAH